MHRDVTEIEAAAMSALQIRVCSLRSDIWCGPEWLFTAGSFRAAGYCLTCFFPQAILSVQRVTAKRLLAE